ncbi:MAG TPA: S41 family peptidase [Pyrinomonadaceae bacterium]|nr:S41 family peptidase [Pyrinomonadaceae bacterium]
MASIKQYLGRCLGRASHAGLRSFRQLTRTTGPVFLCAVTAFQTAGASVSPAAQQAVSVDRYLGLDMLQAIRQDLKEFYYDPNFHGIDLEARYKLAQQQVKAAESAGQMFALIGQFLLDLKDSHTSFIPPTLQTTVDYGWLMQLYGDKCYVVALKPDSDAFAKGLRLGDEIDAIDGFKPTRENIAELLYSYYVLMPAVRMTVTVRDPKGALRPIEIASAVVRNQKSRPSSKADPAPCYEASGAPLICKLTTFEARTKDIDRMMAKASHYEKLILDLRGNEGGAEDVLLHLIGYFFDREVRIGTSLTRKQPRKVVAKPHGKDGFKGQLIVLVDSNSASASEIFARVIQIEKRGQVVGDRTAGMVMGSIVIAHPIGERDILFQTPRRLYFVSVTVDELVMSDGRRLENVGVSPDVVALPAPSDLAAARDPVLTRAAASFGFEIDPAKAGALWPANKETEKRNEPRERANQ